jgi:hypothetical protein
MLAFKCWSETKICNHLERWDEIQEMQSPGSHWRRGCRERDLGACSDVLKSAVTSGGCIAPNFQMRKIMTQSMHGWA